MINVKATAKKLSSPVSAQLSAREFYIFDNEDEFWKLFVWRSEVICAFPKLRRYRFHFSTR